MTTSSNTQNHSNLSNPSASPAEPSGSTQKPAIPSPSALQGPSLSLSKKGRWFALGALLVAGGAFALIAGGGLGENLVYYWGPAELIEKGSKAIGPTIRLGGQVAEGSIEFDESSSALRFAVSDGAATVAVRSVGVPPQMFRENIGVIVEGTYTKEGYFASDRLMVSHGNEYKVPEEGDPVDVYELSKTATGAGETR